MMEEGGGVNDTQLLRFFTILASARVTRLMAVATIGMGRVLFGGLWNRARFPINCPPPSPIPPPPHRQYWARWKWRCPIKICIIFNRNLINGCLLASWPMCNTKSTCWCCKNCANQFWLEQLSNYKKTLIRSQFITLHPPSHNTERRSSTHNIYRPSWPGTVPIN